MVYENKRRLMRIEHSNIVNDVQCQIQGLGEIIHLSMIDFNQHGAQVQIKDSSTLKAIEAAAAEEKALTMSIYFGSLILRSPRPFRIIWINHHLCRMGVEFEDQKSDKKK
jgi:hypothetical protein